MNLKSEIAKRIGVAIILSSFWSFYDTLLLKTLVILVIVILILSCIVLKFRRRLSYSWWKKLVEASEFEVTFAALGLALVVSGIRLLTSETTWWGIAYVLAGGFFIGAGIGDNIALSTMSKKTKIITAIVFICLFLLLGLLNLI